MAKSFGAKLEGAFATYGQLCVGIDPHEELLEEWGLEVSSKGLARFSHAVLDACVGQVGIIKPQVSFFERFGSKGYAELESLISEATAAGLIVIADAKRGDIGTTMSAYLKAWFDRSSTLNCDALTFSPFLGVETVLPLMDEYIADGKGLFTLVATSNPEARKLQSATIGSVTITDEIWAQLGRANSVTSSPGELHGPFGAVVGATLDVQMLGLELSHAAQTPVLAPGFGAQGAELSSTRRIFGHLTPSVIATVSRSITKDGPTGVAASIAGALAELVTGVK